MAASTRSDSSRVVHSLTVRIGQKKTIASGRPSVGSLNLRHAGDVGAPATRLHRRHAHLDISSAIETGTPTLRLVFTDRQSVDDSRRPVFTPSAGRPRPGHLPVLSSR